jgi:hypothetical protein
VPTDGGIPFDVTSVLIFADQGFVSLYVTKDIGATFPGAWQSTQCFVNIG